ncbi:trypsin-like serine peptidase [Micromonospora zhanjiangensis]
MLLITLTTVATVGGQAGASAAASAPNSATSAVATVNGTAATDAGSTGAALEAYWTPERMRSAIPADKPAAVPTGSTGSTSDKPTGPATVAAAPQAASVKATDRANLNVNASITVGKIFFHDESDGKDYVCSGSTINNPTKNIVVTAGHCVHGGKGKKWHTNWQFVPYYDHGSRPYGTWWAKQLTSFKGWTQNGSYDWDLAFVNVWPNGSTRLVDQVGGNGLIVNYAKNLYVTLLAYPAGAPYDGSWQYACQGNMYAYGSEQVGFNCLLTGGASGGPFLYQYSDATGLGYVDSVISHGPDTINYGPYFDTDVLNLYNGVANYS